MPEVKLPSSDRMIRWGVADCVLTTSRCGAGQSTAKNSRDLTSSTTRTRTCTRACPLLQTRKVSFSAENSHMCAHLCKHMRTFLEGTGGCVCPVLQTRSRVGTCSPYEHMCAHQHFFGR